MWQPLSPAETPRSPPTGDPGSPAGTKTKNPGRRFAQVIKIKRGSVDEYKTCQAVLWTDVSKQLKACGFDDYCIWYEDRAVSLFTSFRYIGYDYAGDLQRLVENPVVAKWWALLDCFHEFVAAGTPLRTQTGEPPWWKPVEAIFQPVT